MVIGIFGYRWIHRVMQATAVIVGVSMIIMLIQGLRYGSLPAKETTMARAHRRPVPGRRRPARHRHAELGAVRVGLHPVPAREHQRAAAVLGHLRRATSSATFFSCTIGAYLAALLPSLGPVAAIGKISGKWALVIMALSLINADTLNAYTGAFQVLAFGNMWRRFKSVSVMLRVVPFLCVMAAGVLIALLGYKHFVSNLSNFLDVLLVIFIPWSAVNLTDYFLVRRGNYDVTAFFIPDGVYGKFAWRGLVAYAVGLAAEWPFVSQPDYVGPLVSHLGGADISWLVGFFVSAVVYLILVVSSAPETGRHDRQVAATSRWR